MKKSLIFTCVLLSVCAFADDQAPAGNQTVDLNAKVVQLGTLSNPENSALNQTFQLKRTASTPKEVEVKFALNYVEKECVDYQVEYTQVPELKKTVCVEGLDKSHSCEEQTYEAFQTAVRKCKKEGLVLKTGNRSFKLNFKKAVTLTPNADELYEVNLAQKDMKGTDYSLKAKALETDAVYKIKVSREKVTFKAQ